MRARRRLLLLLAGMATAACSKTSPAQMAPDGGGSGGMGGDLALAPGERVFHFDFARDLQGWIADFSDYPFGQEANYELTSGHRALPAPLDTSRGGFFISGNNHSDDLFMYLRGQLSGLPPHTAYAAEVALQLASDSPADCGGVGGAPGEGVTVKAGVTAIEPTAAAMNHTVDKGNQAVGGRDAVAVGDVAVPGPCSGDVPYQLKRFGSAGQPLAVTSGADGSAWALVGTDSGFEATSAFYYLTVDVTLRPQP